MAEEKRGEAWARERWERLQPILFPEEWPEEDRTLSGEFVVEAMLDRRWAQMPEGFFLLNAVISTPLVRRYACVEGEICFEACLFQEAVSVTYTEFKRRIRFLGSVFNGDLNLEAGALSELWLYPSAKGNPTLLRGGANFFALNVGERLICEKVQFLNETKEAYFNSIEVANHVSLKESLFRGPVNFIGAEIGGQLICDKTQFLSKEGIVYFNSAKISQHALFREAVFEGPVDFLSAKVGVSLYCSRAIFHEGVTLVEAVIESSLYFDQAKFLNAKQPVRFNGIRVGGLASFYEATFQGPADFLTAEIRGQLYCEKAQFLGADAVVELGSAKISDHLSLSGSVFHGPVKLGATHIGGQLICDRTQFLNQAEEVYMNGAKIAHHASFQEALFQGPVNFVGVEIGGQLICDRAQFLSQEGLAYFNGAKVAHHASFRDARFHGPVDFGVIEIGNQFLCERAQFLNPSKIASFNSARVKGGGFFREASFHGPVNFVGISLGTCLYCEEAKFLNPHDMVNFDNMQVEGFASFQGAFFAGPVYLSHGIFSHNLLLEGVQFKSFLSFYNTRVAGTLYVFSPSETEGGTTALATELPDAADLRGLTYDRTDLESGERWRKWIRLRHDADSYDPGPYLVLEQSFRRAGRDDLGDQVHFEMRRAEGRFLQRRRRFGKFALHSLWRWSVGYGVGGERLFYLISAAFVSTYFLIYSADRQGLFQPGKEPDSNPFSPLWYTLDIFLPGVSLDYQSHWQTIDGVVSSVIRAMTLVGWILVPLAVAQLAGLLKRKE